MASAANDRYTKELRKVMQNDKPARETSLTTAEIETSIAEISMLLRGSLSNAERLCLVEDRVELRTVLAARVAPLPSADRRSA